MIKRLLKYKAFIGVILSLIFLEPSITSWLYLWLQKLYNTVNIGTPKVYIIGLLMTGISVWMIKRLIAFTVSVVKSKFICSIKQDLKHDLFVNAMGMNTASLSHIASSGEYISTFTNDIAIIEQRYFNNIISLCSNIISLLILGSTFFTMTPKLATFVFIFSVLVMFVPAAFSKKLNSSNLIYSNNLSKFTQKIKEFLNGYSTIKNYSVETVICEKFDEKNEEVEDSKYIYDCSLSRADSIGSLLTWFTRVVVIGVGLVLLSRGEMLLGTIVAAQAFAEEIATPLQSIVENANAIRSVKSIVQKIEDITSIPIDMKPVNTDMANPFSEINIQFDNLSIAVDEKVIVENFSFEFQQGKKYLIIGKNGSGKSSLFKALKKRFQSYSGEILINGTNIKQLTNHEISTLVSYLNENVSLFSGSLKDNITFWNYFADEQLERAIDRSHIEINSERFIGEDGYNISSGEQRRIEIARSMLSPTKVLIYDEVVSTLDIETAYEIEKEALEFEDKTVIFISHNFSGKLIKQYDGIIVMKDGGIVASGTYDELISTCDYFKKICSIKFGM